MIFGIGRMFSLLSRVCRIGMFEHGDGSWDKGAFRRKGSNPIGHRFHRLQILFQRAKTSHLTKTEQW